MTFFNRLSLAKPNGALMIVAAAETYDEKQISIDCKLTFSPYY